MGQREHISAASIMRAGNKVIHRIPFEIMQVWALDQEKDHKAKLLKNRLASGQLMLFLLFNIICTKCFIGNPQKKKINLYVWGNI